MIQTETLWSFICHWKLACEFRSNIREMKLIHVQLSSVTDSLVIKVHDTINAYYRGLRRITGFSKWFAGYNFRDHNRNVLLDTSMDEQLRRNIDSILEATPSNIHNPQSLVSHTSCHIWALQAGLGTRLGHSIVAVYENVHRRIISVRWRERNRMVIT